MRTITLTAADGYGLTMHIQDGTGIPILFLSGLLLPASTWQPVLAELPGRTCLCLEMRGHGQSPPIASEITVIPFATHVADVRAAMAQLALPRCHVVGLSLGGMVAIELALKPPPWMASLGIIGSSADGELPQRIPEFSAMVDVLLAHGMTPELRDSICSLYLRPETYADRSPNGLRAALERELSAGDPHSLAAVCRGAVMRPSRMQDLYCISVPVLGLCGVQDGIIAPCRQRQTVQPILGGVFATVEDSGHLTTCEQPVVLARHLRQHFERVEEVPA